MIREGHGSEWELRGWGRNKGRSDRGKGKERCHRRCHEDRGMGMPGCRVGAARESRGGVMMGGEVF